MSLDDVQVLGEWNFTLQSDTPLFWIKSGQLERYLLRFRAQSYCNPATFGFVFHAEADGPGTDGVSFWVERSAARTGLDYKPAVKRYILAGDGLDSKPVITREYPDVDGHTVEDCQMLVQGYTGCIFLQDKKVQIKFRLKQMKGSVAFYNTTQNQETTRDEVFFSGVAITAMRRGPLEVAGVLARRERQILGHSATAYKEEESIRSKNAGADEAGGGFGEQPDVTARPYADSAAVTFAQTTSTQFRGSRAGSQAAMRSTAPSFGGRGSMGSPARGMNATVLAGGPQFASNVASVAGRRGRLGQSASDGMLKKTKGSGDSWLPLATNSFMREQDLMRNTMKPRRHVDSSNACSDFIAM